MTPAAQNEKPATYWRRISALVLFAGLMLAALAFANSGRAAIETPPPPSVWSDKADYAPGELVTLSGANWAAGEVVHIRVNDDAGETWRRDVDVTADASGAISDQFNLPMSFVAVYSVTATGASSGTATWTFTDAVATSTTLISSLNPSNSGDSVTFTATVTCSVACTFPAGSSVDFVENANSACNGGTTLGSTTTLTGSGLSRQATFTTSTLAGGTHLIRACYVTTATSGDNTQKSNSDPALSQVVNACTSPSVTTNPTNASVTYGANATFTAAASGSPAPTVQWQVDSGSGFTNLAGATSASLTLTKPTVSMSGNKYRAVSSNGCGSATSTAATLTVAPKNLTISGAVAQNKVYDGNTTASVSFAGATLNGVVAPDVVTINSSSYSATFANKNIGTAKPVTVTGVTLSGADAGNYTVSQPSGLTADITAKTLSVSFQADNKAYDGNTSATIKSSPAPALVGVVSGDVVVLGTGGASASFDTKNVGTGKTVTGSGFTKSGADAGNYVFASPQGTTTADITAKNLTISGAVAQNKVYDGNTTASVSFAGATLNGVVAPDVVTINSSGHSTTFNNKNAGLAKPVTVTGVTLSGADAGNYTVSQPSGLTADIAKRNVTASITAADKTYDGTDAASITSCTLEAETAGHGVVSPDDVGCTASNGHFDDKNAGLNKPVSADVALNGADQANYQLTSATAATTATISKAPLDIYAVSDSKVYDGTQSSTGLPTVGAGQLQGSDSVTGKVQKFQSKNVMGTNGSTLEVTAYTVNDGNAGGNYNVALHTASGTITMAALDISAVSDTKVYDGTRDSSATPTVSGLQPGDSVTGKVQKFQSKNVMGTNGSTLEVTAYTVNDGNAGGNYNVALHTASGTITKKSLTVTGITANNKPWDGSTTATLNVGGAALVGAVSGDAVTLNTGGAAGTFASASVGTWTVTISGLTISGADSGNYSLTQPTTTATIGAWNAQGYGFYQPVGIPNSIFTPAPASPPMNKPVTVDWNTVKGGSTVPLKFNVFAGSVEKTSLSNTFGPVPFQTAKLNTCVDAASEDAVDFTTTGNTSLRYESMWIQNWKTPTASSDTCYRAWATFADGSTLEAFFKLKK